MVRKLSFRVETATGKYTALIFEISDSADDSPPDLPIWEKIFDTMEEARNMGTKEMVRMRTKSQ